MCIYISGNRKVLVGCHVSCRLVQNMWLLLPWLKQSAFITIFSYCNNAGGWCTNCFHSQKPNHIPIFHCVKRQRWALIWKCYFLHKHFSVHNCIKFGATLLTNAGIYHCQKATTSMGEEHLEIQCNRRGSK